MEFERRVSGKFVSRVFFDADGALAQSLLSRAGLDVAAPGDEVAIEQFFAGLSVYASAKHPEASTAEAMRRVGFETVKRGKKYDGRSLDEAMSLLPMALTNIAPFLEPKVHTHGERYVAHFGDVGSLHTFFLGVLEAVTSSTHPGVQVKWSPEGLSGARYEVRLG
jgi:hypothetical protein